MNVNDVTSLLDDDTISLLGCSICMNVLRNAVQIPETALSSGYELVKGCHIA